MSKIVLVDDDPTLSHLLKTLLEMEGYQISVIEKGSEADIARAIQQEQPEFLLMDVHLNTADGIGILTRLRNSAQPNPGFVIMTSGMDVKDQCMEAGADAFLLKPYMPDELLALLNR